MMDIIDSGSASDDRKAESSQSAMSPAEPVARKPPEKPPYPLPSARPTQDGGENILYDFNEGCRVYLPTSDGYSWHVRLTDLDTGNILFEKSGLAEALAKSSKRWYVRFGIQVWKEKHSSDEKIEQELVFHHEFDARGKQVLIFFPIGTLGDTLAWMPYAARFAEVHGARVICGMSKRIIPLLADAYPEITFLTHEEVSAQNLTGSAYATYYLGLFFDDVACDWQPTDFRFVGLHKTAAYILGVSTEEEAARVSFPDEGRPIEGPYVCIAVQASAQCKYWNNPGGWSGVISWLKERGYRVVCIDQKSVSGSRIVWNHIPFGVEDQTGDRPLSERLRWLKHAALFIGGSSGLAWLAWSAGCPVVMISGFTHPTNEFATPFRVINWHTCNSCWNDPKERFDHADFLWCPRHKDTPRQFECSRLITSEQVIRSIGSAINHKHKDTV